MSDYPYIEVEKKDRSILAWPWVAVVQTGAFSHSALHIAHTRAGAIKGCRKKWEKEQTRKTYIPERVEL